MKKKILTLALIISSGIFAATAVAAIAQDAQAPQRAGSPGATEPPTARTIAAEEQKYVGIWGGIVRGYTDYYRYIDRYPDELSGIGEIYYELKDDGTFKEVLVGIVRRELSERPLSYHANLMTFAAGSWHLSNGNLYLTNRMTTSWNTFNPGYVEAAEQITPMTILQWQSEDDVVILDAFYCPAGESAPTKSGTKSEYDRIYPASYVNGENGSFSLERRVVMPTGAVANAFVHIPLAHEKQAAPPPPKPVKPLTTRTTTAEEQKYFGIWGGTIHVIGEYGLAGGGDIYFEFKDDGTFKEVRVTYTRVGSMSMASLMTLKAGNWRESDGSLYFTNCMFTYWNANIPGYTEREQLTPKRQGQWQSIDDSVIEDITYYPAGKPDHSGSTSSDDRFYPASYFNKEEGAISVRRRVVMPVGPVANAFEIIPLPW
ncbi:MAG: hypothetical protein FWF87_02210 [Synergistaceae bacterium]|nr:hypothetical protein [Synergistaceae bacterium]